MEKGHGRIVGIVSVAVICLAVTALRAMGREWWCSCGSPVPWSWDIWSSHNSQHLIDPYFFTHVLHGLLFFAGLRLLQARIVDHWRFFMAITIEACWEILENSPMIIERFRESTISLDYFGDSIANSVFDIVACALGYWLASSVRWWWPVAVFLIVELILLVTIRDCLTLNIIMLLWPIEGLKEWQVS